MRRLVNRVVLLVGLCCAVLDVSAQPTDGAASSNDVALIEKSRHGLDGIIAYVASRPETFPPRAPSRQRVLTPVQRQEARDIWGRFLDHQLMLDSIWQRLSAPPPGADDKHAAFRLRYAAFLARYRYALDFIALVDADPALRVVLNEPVDELGLPARSYADFKFRFLNVAIATEFAALSATHRGYGADDKFPLASALRLDESRIWAAGKGHGVLNTLRNAGQIVQDGGARLVFPVQKGVSEWMGDTRVLYGAQHLVTDDQIATLTPKLLPGDVMLVRREWFLSNIGLPGFWPHAALYIGSPEERKAYFNDPAVQAWLVEQGITDGSMDTLLKTRQPAAYAVSQQPDAHGFRPRVIEAMSEGVSLTTLEHSAAADSVAVLRPRLSRLEVAKAILKALEFHGRPYDFDFDFRTDATLVCTELVYKAYSPTADKHGLDLPIKTVAGRPVLTANDIAQHFDATWGEAGQQFDLIAFLDGQARSKRADDADLARFRASWKRPKWHILVQDSPLAAK